MTWDEAVCRYSRLIMSVGVRHGLRRADAEDALQRTWQKALELRETPPERGAAKWLVCIAYLAVRNVQRRRTPAAVDPATLDDWGRSPQEPPPELLERLEREQAVREALDELPPVERRLVAALFLAPERRSYVETARSLGVAANGIGSRRTRALARLREILERRGFNS